MNKKLTISIPVLIVIIVSVVTTTIMMNNKEPVKDPRLSSGVNQLEDNEEMTMDEIHISIGDKEFEMDLENNSTVSALVKMLPLKLLMNDLNGNEKYAYLDQPLPTNAYSPEHIEAGDVMLFENNCIVIFYKSFDTSYIYSKIGHIDDLPALGGGDISVVLNNK